MAGVPAGAPSGWSLMRAAHLLRRFLGSLSRAEPSTADVAWVRSVLTVAELGLWDAMTVQDRRHSVLVARRFTVLAPHADRAAVAGALLHDVGKQVAGLGTTARVIATLVGPRTRRFREYHDHEALGAAMLRRAGVEESTVANAIGAGPFADALRDADDI